MSKLTNEQLNRYERTILLDEIGEKGQSILLNSKVAIVGVGGLASSSIIYLASTGIGELTLIDDDVVSLNNLPRQVLFDYQDIGKSKVEAAKEKIKRLNPDVKVNVYKERLNVSNASKLLKGHDIVLDCTDNFDTKFLINDICLKLNIPFVTAGISDYQGQVCTTIPNKSKDFKSLFSILPKADKGEVIGVFPLSVGVIGDIASAEVVKYIVNIGELLTNKLLVVNLLTNHYQIIKFPK